MSTLEVKNYKGVEVGRVKNAPSAEDAETRLKDAIIDKIVDANDIEVPQDLVDDEAAMMVRELNHRMKYENMISGRNFPFMQDDTADHMEEIKAEAFRLVKARLVINGIIQMEKFEVSREELEKEAEAISVRQQMPIGMVKSFLGEDLKPLENDLLVRKAIDFVYANAVIK